MATRGFIHSSNLISADHLQFQVVKEGGEDRYAFVQHAVAPGVDLNEAKLVYKAIKGYTMVRCPPASFATD
jgi:hypothetical protein